MANEIDLGPRVVACGYDGTRERAIAVNEDGAITTLGTSTVTIDGLGNSAAASITQVASGDTGTYAVTGVAGLRLLGVSTWEPTGAVARVILRHGSTAAGPAIVLISLAANGMHTEWFGDSGIGCPNGIYVDRIGGHTHLSIWTKVVV